MLGVLAVVIQLHCGERDIRRDGMPRADARVTSPAVAIAFQCAKGAMTFPCDEFDDWQSNIRAIALGLEALRKIERYGITPNNEQYTGWAKLDAPMTKEVARETLYRMAGLNQTCPVKDARSRAILAAHPDRNDGDDTKWRELQTVLSTLGLKA